MLRELIVRGPRDSTSDHSVEMDLWRPVGVFSPSCVSSHLSRSFNRRSLVPSALDVLDVHRSEDFVPFSVISLVTTVDL